MAQASLHESPYLSSPIRPIPSFNRNQSRSSTSNAKWSPTFSMNGKGMSRCNSPNHSTIASLRLNSPHTPGSIFSVQSSVTHACDSRRQSLARMILLPEDDLTGYDIFTTKNDQHELTNKPCSQTCEEKYGGDEYSTSDFDEDETISSEYANSVNDNMIIETMKLIGNSDAVLYGRGEDALSQKNPYDSEQEQTIKVKEWTDIKLPAVPMRNLISATREGKTTQRVQGTKGNSTSLMNSPYALQTKKATRKGKIKNNTGRKEQKDDFRF